ncbi:EAL domain-containing protein [Ruminococcus sp. AM47-2BH]|nr:EAL domain-containing protein [Ruminococcus sp. AM47-2BH]
MIFHIWGNIPIFLYFLSKICYNKTLEQERKRLALSGNSTVDGVRAVELFYRPIKNTDSGRVTFLQSQTRLNSPAMGTLMPADYLPVAQLSDRCVSIFKLAFVQLLQALGKFHEREVDVDWASVFMPARFLRQTEAPRVVADYCDKFGVKYERVCFELSSDVLDEADSTAADNVALMRRQGFHFLLTGFGTEGFKMLKTAEFKVDNIMLDGSVAQVLGKSDRYDTCVNSLLNFVFDLNAEVIADGITDDKQVKQLSGMQCLYYSGENAGKYIAERYVRNRNE